MYSGRQTSQLHRPRWYLRQQGCGPKSWDGQKIDPTKIEVFANRQAMSFLSAKPSLQFDPSGTVAGNARKEKKEQVMTRDYYDEKRFKDLEWTAMHWEIPSQLDVAVEAALTPAQREASDRQAHEDFVAMMQRRLLAMPCSETTQ